ncbi:hypothetical protein CKM354_001024500 [Cercospora kikuchii]|uniref:Transport protein particle component n=1 Tax=Cercospora kikuchii TaxID=84275 RepID=A0A9P3FKS9_9PEZI|nr:uncharacterized protein CKM354_001024500 [Cercospora kikuchii]GIZ47145.1 hypothetical protein CKM354_001024500 [Cercospora kikuchii]
MSRPNPSGIPEDDIINPKLNVSCLDFLLIELVPLAQRITDQLHAREQALIEEFRRSKIFNNSSSNGSSTTPSAITQQSQSQSQPTGSLPTVPEITTTSNGAGSGKKTSSEAGAEASTTTTTTTATGTAATSVISTSNIGGAPLLESSSTREAVFWRLDNLGYRVGQGLVERFSHTKPRPQTPLEAIKFICKDLWTILFRKQIDNLKTNHRGVFVLTDSRFQPISRMSVDRRAGPRAGEDALRRGQAYLYFPCGIIRGALQGLAIEVTVTAETMEIPVATFQIKMKGAKA